MLMVPGWVQPSEGVEEEEQGSQENQEADSEEQ